MKQECCGKPPFDDLKSVIEMTGYEVIGIEAERDKLNFSGIINIQIIPKKWIEQTDFISFPQIPQDLIVNLRECSVQQSPQCEGKDE